MSQTAPLSIWSKLIRQPAAVLGGCISLLALFLAIAGYWISPDSSPHANRMIVEIASRSPGFTQDFLLIPKSPQPPKRNWLERTVSGQPDPFQFIPIGNWEVQGDSLIYQQYIDEGIYDRKSASLQAFGGFDAGTHIVRQKFYLGTDKFGRDILSRLIIGTRISLLVGGIAMLLSLTIGLLLGTLAGYYGGRYDQAITWLINVIWSIPTLLLVFAITLLLGKGFWQVFIAVGLTMWVNVARLVRGQLIAMRNLEYVEAARALGYRDMRIILRHILPNIMGPVLVVAAANFASAIVVEAGLSFLGVGVQPPQPSWGGMIKENYNFIITNNPMLALAPGFAIMLLVLAFNLIGNGIRDALDVRA